MPVTGSPRPRQIDASRNPFAGRDGLRVTGSPRLCRVDISRRSFVGVDGCVSLIGAPSVRPGGEDRGHSDDADEHRVSDVQLYGDRPNDQSGHGCRRVTDRQTPRSQEERDDQGHGQVRRPWIDHPGPAGGDPRGELDGKGRHHQCGAAPTGCEPGDEHDGDGTPDAGTNQRSPRRPAAQPVERSEEIEADWAGVAPPVPAVQPGRRKPARGRVADLQGEDGLVAVEHQPPPSEPNQRHHHRQTGRCGEDRPTKGSRRIGHRATVTTWRFGSRPHRPVTSTWPIEGRRPELDSGRAEPTSPEPCGRGSTPMQPCASAPRAGSLG